MDVGLVCDRCSTASAMGTPRCIRCGASLSLEDDGRAESAPYADDADVAYDDAAGGGSFGHDTAREPYGLEATPPPYGQATATPAPASTPAPAPVFARSASASFDHDPHGLRASAAEPETRVGAPSLRAPAPPDPSAAVPCGECGSPVPPGQRFCGNCGARVDPNRRTGTDGEKPGRSTLFFSTIQNAHARLTVISGEGLDGTTFTLAGTDHLAGRVDCPILFADDPYLSPVHANFFYRGGHLVVRDEGSINGVYVRMLGTVVVPDGTRVMVGEQILEIGIAPEAPDEPDPDGTFFFASPSKGRVLRVAQPLRGGGVGLVRLEPGGKLRVGREGNDLDFPEDPFISGHHALLELDGDELRVTDLSSKNGTFLRIRGEQTLAHGDYVFMGQQLLRVEIV